MDDDWYMRIGEVADRTGVARSALRFWERRGVLPAPGRTPAGYRAYGPDALARVRFIRKAQGLGLRLEDVREILRIADEGRSPCPQVRARLEARLRGVEHRLAELHELRATLLEAVAALEEGFERPPGGGTCAVIEATSPPG